MTLDAIHTILSSPALAAIAAAAGETPAYLVGGAVRDLLDGREPDELDVAVEGEVDALLAAGGWVGTSHARFGTAVVEIEGVPVDLARTRRETYEHPGALPAVEPAPIRADLARRDFTVNAMAVPLRSPVELIDPYDGDEDLRSRTLRVIHPRSFVDDPTRALRAARYCARLALAPDPETGRLLRAADLSTVSDDRIAAELRRIAAEPEPLAALELIGEWGLIEIGERRLALAAAAGAVLAGAPWRELVAPPEILLRILLAADRELEEAVALGSARPGSASAAHELARGKDDELLAIARIAGGEWIDGYLASRATTLEIDGGDLLAAGVEQGPAIGRGLRAAFDARLDGEIPPGRESELAAALAAVDAEPGER